MRLFIKRLKDLCELYGYDRSLNLLDLEVLAFDLLLRYDIRVYLAEGLLFRDFPNVNRNNYVDYE